MKSQNQMKYFLNTNVDAYGITKGNIVMYVVAKYICIKYLNFWVFQGQIVFPSPPPQNLLDSTFPMSTLSTALAK